MSELSRLLLPWFERHGRKDLPWQKQVTPYRVWLSEIMLQQTQVSAVIPYYERFLGFFPDVMALADAGLDQVLLNWAGLGYYARARNLHKTAQIIRDEFGGMFPGSLEQLMALPGIGQSTAGAILSLAFGQHAAILDGNVKRVLARVYQVDGWSGMSAASKQLWQLAAQQTPSRQTAFYNQAMMDLGSTVCKRSRPKCEDCPLQGNCLSYRHNTQALFPVPKPKKARVQKHRWLLLHCDSDGLLLERRPRQGIWGGLWSLPEIEQLGALTDWQTAHVGEVSTDTQLSENLLRHQFSHFELTISLIEIRVPGTFVKASQYRVNENSELEWIAWNELSKYGMPAPVERLLNQRMCNE